MVEIVAEPHVGGGSLRRNRLQSRMRLEGSHDGRPAVVRNAQHAHTAVIGRDILEHPFDGVEGIGPLVQGRCLPCSARRALHDERSFRAILAANVLERKDVTFLYHRLEVCNKVARAALDPIGRAFQDNGQWLALVFRGKYLCVKAHTVPHRDHDVRDLELLAGVVLPEERRQRQEQEHDYRKSDAPAEVFRVVHIDSSSFVRFADPAAVRSKTFSLPLYMPPGPKRRA